MNDRTQIAAMVLAGCWAPLDEGASRITYAVAQADALLAELAKTAKPDAEWPPEVFEKLDWWQGRCAEWQARAEAAEARVKELEAELKDDNRQWQDVVEQRKAFARERISTLTRAFDNALSKVKELEARNAQLRAQIAALLAAQTAPGPIPFEWTCSTGPTAMLQEPKP